MRLSALDGSFLRNESPQAHMHVGWTAVFRPPATGPRPTAEDVRERVASRLDRVPWCRWRLRQTPLGLTEPRWVEDERFDLAAHVVEPCPDGEVLGMGPFAALRDALLSQPLDHSRPLWRMFIVPRLQDDRMAIIGKVHHALVDGMAALQITQLLADDAPGAFGGDEVPCHHPGASRGSWVSDGVGRAAADARGVARALTQPAATVRGGVRGAGRVLRAAREDLLPGAPTSPLNVPIGARRSLVTYRARRPEVRAARRAGGTINDIGLAVAAGALRTLAQRGGEQPDAPWKVMVPVNMREIYELDQPGNNIAMVNLDLPVHLGDPMDRLARVRRQTRELKRGDRADATKALYAAGGLLPAPLRSPVARAMASPRTFNLTVSQSPAPRELAVLGCELEEVYSVVPITQGHALAIGMVRFRQELFIGCYADPDAFPRVHELPALLDDELRTLAAHATSTAPAGEPAPSR